MAEIKGVCEWSYRDVNISPQQRGSSDSLVLIRGILRVRVSSNDKEYQGRFRLNFTDSSVAL